MKTVLRSIMPGTKEVNQVITGTMEEGGYSAAG
jgi:hypothetical protein